MPSGPALSSLRLAPALLAFALAACAPLGPLGPLDSAARRAAAGSGDARQLALGGLQALLVTGDAELARTRLDAAVAADPGEPWALYGQRALAARAAHPERSLEVMLDLLERRPRHPLAAVAARVALDQSGQGAAFDQLLRARVPRLLALPVPGDAGHLLRAALVNALWGAGEAGARQRVLADMGVATSAALVGPFSAWHRLGMDAPTPVEVSGRLDALPPGPFGPLQARAVHFADGRFALSGEPGAGDVYLLAVDATVARAGTYVLRTITSLDHVVVLDGAMLLDRRVWSRPASSLSSRAVKLAPGKHRLVVRFARERQAGLVTLALQRLDGAPAEVAFAPAEGAPEGWSAGRPVDAAPPAEGLYPTAQDLEQALEPEVGAALAAYVAARDGLGRDHDGSARLVRGLPAGLDGPAVAMLRADLAVHDPAVPARVSHGRANKELEAILARDPRNAAAQLLAARLAEEDGRQLEALEHLQGAPLFDGPPSGPVLAMLARLQLGAGLDAAAADTARKAGAALPGLCEGALVLEYDVARRRDAIAESDALLERTAHCPGFLQRAVEHLRARGRTEEALARARELLALDESQAGTATTVAGLLAALRRYDESVAVLEGRLGLWPRSPQLLKALGDVEEQAGHPARALAARERALLVDGGDLALRRAVERAHTGKELLAEEAISTREALADYQASPGSEDATSAFVLDFAATRAYPDGSSVDRIHVIQKALDQQGVQEVAEVHLPPDAALLALRTLKPDGRRLEPETIDGKDGVSLPGVQVGDLVEYEYLLAHPARGPGLPGFTAGNFYFQIARQPNSRSTYVVKAPRGAGLKVDAHHVQAPEPRVEGDLEVFRHVERRVPPYIPEPQAPPSANEWLPFVSVGAGEEGSRGLLTSYADGFLDNGLVTDEVAAFARAAAGPATGEAAVRRVHAAVMEKLSGRDAGLAMSAASSVAQDRGSRTWLLYAAVKALGFPVRLVAVRTFAADPAPYRFPADGLYDYLCVRVQVGEGATARAVWLDPVVRFGPFGELPEFAAGGREAWLLPEPGKASERVETPAAVPHATKTVALTMALSEEGVLSGEGKETYAGFEAAQLAEALESMNTEQRDQALQAALARYFGGADLSGLTVDTRREVGGTVTVAYHFVAPRFGRVEGPGKLVASALTFPHQLGRRYLATPTRTTPLFIEATETAAVTARLTLPPGWRLKDPVGEVKLEGPSGRFQRSERQDGEVLSVTEAFHLEQSRIAPQDYQAFGQFAGEVDLLQQREVFFEKGGGGAVVSTRL